MITSQNNSLVFIASLNGRLFEFLGVTQATSYSLNTSTDLISGRKREGGLEELLSELGAISLESHFSSSGESTTVFHLFYELGFALEEKADVHPSESDTLGIVLKFSEKRPYEISPKSENIELLDTTGPTSQEYFEAFRKGLTHLKRGDCYQYNLTFPFKVEMTPTSLDNFISNSWATPSLIGRFASVTKLPTDSSALFSNSPECLFNIEKKGDSYTLETFPIKGTESTSGKDPDEAWRKLSSSLKDQSELFMITDLMRNDLSRLSGEWANVVAKKEKMFVPGLVHSYSHIKTELKKEVSLKEIVESLFPGGSITGAPKVRVMEIIETLEGHNRGFYCGSTIVASENNLSASINIRAGLLNYKKGEMQYHAGGGITFDSDPELEFQEMWDKVQSFTRRFVLRQNEKPINSNL